MGTTSTTPTIEATTSKNEENFEKFKDRIHKNASKIIASFPEKTDYLTRFSQGLHSSIKTTSPPGNDDEQSSDTGDFQALYFRSVTLIALDFGTGPS
jgi:hypothetical protein